MNDEPKQLEPESTPDELTQVITDIKAALEEKDAEIARLCKIIEDVNKILDEAINKKDEPREHQ